MEEEGDATAAEEGSLVSPSCSEGGGDQWPRGAELCADMSTTPLPAAFSLCQRGRASKWEHRKIKFIMLLAAFACHLVQNGKNWLDGIG